MELRLLDLSEQGIERTCRLLRVVFPQAAHLTPAYLERLYNGNPLGPTTGLSAFEGDDLIGHYLMIPLVSVIHGREERGIWPFQLATHPECRNAGIFSALVEASFELARKDGYTHFSGVGNAQSTPIFTRKWKFRNVCPLDVRIGFGTVRPVGEMSGCQFRRVWDAGGIAWRLGVPAVPYRVKVRHGYAHLYADTGRYGIQVEVGSFPKEMVPHHLEPLRSPNPLRLWIGKDSTRDWSGTLYVDLPDRFKTSPLNLLFYDLTDQDRQFDPSKVQYDVFNFDAY